MAVEYQGFQYFLLGWMHPNWTDFYKTIEEAMEDFVLTVNDLGELLKCRSDLEEWIDHYTTDYEAESAIKTVESVGYRFSDETMHGVEFLNRLRDSFDRAIKKRKDFA